MGRHAHPPVAFQALAAWLKRTKTSRHELIATLKRREGVAITEQHLSSMFRGCWGCSLRCALAISRVTGVPVEKLVLDQKVKSHKQSRDAA